MGHYMNMHLSNAFISSKNTLRDFILKMIYKDFRFYFRTIVKSLYEVKILLLNKNQKSFRDS